MKKRTNQRLCTRGYALIVRGLASTPASAKELSERHDVTDHVMRGIVRRLHFARLIHVTEWRTATQGPAIRIFGYGDLPDAPQPLTASGKQSVHIGVTARPPRPTAEITSFATLMRALTEKRGQRELVEITGISRTSLAPNLRYMRRLGLIYIAGWERRHQGGAGGAPLPLYRLGIGRSDATKPLPQTKAESNARYNAARVQKRMQQRIVRAICANSSVFNQAA